MKSNMVQPGVATECNEMLIKSWNFLLQVTPYFHESAGESRSKQGVSIRSKRKGCLLAQLRQKYVDRLCQLVIAA